MSNTAFDVWSSRNEQVAQQQRALLRAASEALDVKYGDLALFMSIDDAFSPWAHVRVHYDNAVVSPDLRKGMYKQLYEMVAKEGDARRATVAIDNATKTFEKRYIEQPASSAMRLLVSSSRNHKLFDDTANRRSCDYSTAISEHAKTALQWDDVANRVILSSSGMEVEGIDDFYVFWNFGPMTSGGLFSESSTNTNAAVRMLHEAVNLYARTQHVKCKIKCALLMCLQNEGIMCSDETFEKASSHLDVMVEMKYGTRPMLTDVRFETSRFVEIMERLTRVWLNQFGVMQYADSENARNTIVVSQLVQCCRQLEDKMKSLSDEQKVAYVKEQLAAHEAALTATFEEAGGQGALSQGCLSAGCLARTWLAVYKRVFVRTLQAYLALKNGVLSCTGVKGAMEVCEIVVHQESYRAFNEIVRGVLDDLTSFAAYHRFVSKVPNSAQVLQMHRDTLKQVAYVRSA